MHQGQHQLSGLNNGSPNSGVVKGEADKLCAERGLGGSSQMSTGEQAVDASSSVAAARLRILDKEDEQLGQPCVTLVGGQQSSSCQLHSVELYGSPHKISSER